MLTDTAIRATKPGSKPIKISDAGGLQLLVMPSGSKLWRMAYRFEGRQKQLAFGSYGDVSLKDARVKRDEARKHLANGVDPSMHAKLERIARQATAANTFHVLADEYVTKLRREERAPVTVAKTIWLLNMARLDLRTRPISDISAAEVLAVLRKVEDRGHLETARRLRATLGRVFSYAIATGRAFNDPTSPLKRALASPRVTHRAAITDTRELGGLLRAIDGFTGQATTTACLKLMALLFPRPGELRLSTWPEFDFEKAVWTIPAARTKMRRVHRIPLSKQAVIILLGVKAMSRGGSFVFPSVRTVTRSLSENTLNAALRRLGYSKDEATAHGFRATASTILNESGNWSADAIERQLGHVEGSEVRRAYARGEHWDERVRMMQAWADQLDDLRLLAPGSRTARPHNENLTIT